MLTLLGRKIEVRRDAMLILTGLLVIVIVGIGLYGIWGFLSLEE